MIFKVGSDARATEAAQETCRKLARKKTPSRREKNTICLSFLCVWPRRAADQKIAAKMASEALPESLPGAKIYQLFVSDPGGAPRHFWDLGGGSPGAPGRAQEGQRA